MEHIGLVVVIILEAALIGTGTYVAPAEAGSRHFVDLVGPVYV